MGGGRLRRAALVGGAGGHRAGDGAGPRRAGDGRDSGAGRGEPPPAGPLRPRRRGRAAGPTPAGAVPAGVPDRAPAGRPPTSPPAAWATDSIVAQRDLSRAAKTLAFEYALDRTVVAGEIGPFPDAAARTAQGDQVRALLLNLYPRSRMAVPPPLGGCDRDINTSEEIVSYATAFDTMLGAGYDFGDRPGRHRRARCRSVTDELYRNFSRSGDGVGRRRSSTRTTTDPRAAPPWRSRRSSWPTTCPPPGRTGGTTACARWTTCSATCSSPATAPTARAPTTTATRCRTCCPYLAVWERHLGVGVAGRGRRRGARPARTTPCSPGRSAGCST